LIAMDFILNWYIYSLICARLHYVHYRMWDWTTCGVVVRSVNLISKQTFNSVFRYTGQRLFKDFSTGEGGIFWKGTLLWDMLEGDRYGWRPQGLGAYSPRKCRLKFEAQKCHFLHSEHLNLL
jgi:hypothetical protein